MTELNPKDKIIRFFEKRTNYSDKKGTNIGVYTDTETTGLSDDAEIWEIAILPFTFTDEGDICQVFKPYVGREQPKKPLSDEICRLCGVTNEELEGKSFDDFTVLDTFSKAELAVAHNAKFDRPKIHNRFPSIKNIMWADSAFDPDYSLASINSRTLDYLAFRYGFWFDHHGALADCRGGLNILAQNLTPTLTVFQSLLQRAYSGSTTLELKSGFDSKDIIKGRGGYRWHPDKKVWYKVFTNDEEMDKDITFFDERGDGDIICKTVPEDLKRRFLK